MKKRKTNKTRAGLIDSARVFLSHPAVLTTCKIFIGALFIISSVTKIPNPARFADSIANYKILPDFLLMPMAYTVPWIQLIAGVFIILDIYAQGSAFVLCGLLVVYIAAITSAFIRGFEIECGCFDLLSQVGLEDKVGITAIVRDTIFLLFPGNVFLFDKNSFSLYGIFKRLKK